MIKQRVVQISFDVMDNDQLFHLSNIVKVLEDAGLEVLGADITGSWSLENYERGCASDE